MRRNTDIDVMYGLAINAKTLQIEMSEMYILFNM